MSDFLFSTKAGTLESLAKTNVKSSLCQQLSFSLTDWQKTAKKIVTEIVQFSNGRLLAIRSSASSEDGERESFAGTYLSHTNVIPAPNSIQIAIEAVFKSYNTSSKYDEVLIQPMVKNVAISGVVLTRDLDSGAPYIVINYDDFSGRTDTVTGGSESKTILLRRTKPNALNSPRFLKLLKLTHELENITNTDELDIEFCITHNSDVIILQVRPLTAKKHWKKISDTSVNRAINVIQKNIKLHLKPQPSLAGNTTIFGEMPDWNPAEIIGKNPSPLALSLYKNLITDKIWADARSDMGYKSVNRPLLIDFYGRPYIDVRLSLNSFLPKNTPSKVAEALINSQLERLTSNPTLHDKIEFEVATTCKSFDFVSDKERLRDARLTRTELESVEQLYQNLTREIIEDGLVNIKKQLAQTQLTMNKVGRYSGGKNINFFPVALEKIRQGGTLPFSKLARHGFIGVIFLNSLQSLGVFNKKDISNFMSGIKTITSDFIYDLQLMGTGQIPQKEFLLRYGHLRPGTYDIQSWRYDEKPEMYLSNTPGPDTKKRCAQFELNNQAEREIDHMLKKNGFVITPRQLLEYIALAIRAREESKFYFTKALSNLLFDVAKWGETLKLSREDLSFLPLHVFSEEIKESNLKRQIAQNKCKSEITNSIRLPHLISRLSDIDVVRLPLWQPNFITNKTVTAKIAVININTIQNISEAIVLIESADPGFDWIFSHNIRGLITQYGGVNSHMAIRCAELNLPAAIGCGEQLFKSLKDCKILELNCLNRIVRKIGVQ